MVLVDTLPTEGQLVVPPVVGAGAGAGAGAGDEPQEVFL